MENTSMEHVLLDISQNCEINTDLTKAREWQHFLEGAKMAPELKKFYQKVVDDNVKKCIAQNENRVNELTSQVMKSIRQKAEKNGQQTYESVDEYTGGAPLSVAKKIVACENTDELRKEEYSLKSKIGEYFAQERDFIAQKYDAKTGKAEPLFDRPASEAMFNQASSIVKTLLAKKVSTEQKELYDAFINGPKPALSKNEALKRALFLSKTDCDSLETHSTVLLNFFARLFGSPNQIFVLQGFEIGGQGKGIWLSALESAAEQIGLSFNVSSGITNSKVDSKVGNSVFLVDQEYDGKYCPDINNVADKKIVNIQGKYIYEYQVKSMANLVFATNEDIKDPNDRRYAVVRCDLNRSFDQNFGVCDFPKGYEAAQAWIAEGIKACMWYAVNDHTVKVVKTVNSEGFLQKFSFYLSKLPNEKIEEIKLVETISELATFLTTEDPKTWLNRKEILRPMIQLMNSGKIIAASGADANKVSQYRLVKMADFIEDIINESFSDFGYKAIYEYFTPNGPEVEDEAELATNASNLEELVKLNAASTFVFVSKKNPTLLPVFRCKLAPKGKEEAYYVLHTNFESLFDSNDYDTVYDELNMKFFKGAAKRLEKDKLPKARYFLTTYSLSPFDLKYIKNMLKVREAQADVSFEKIQDELSKTLAQLQNYESTREYLDYMSASNDYDIVGYGYALVNKMESNCYSVDKIREALAKKDLTGHSEKVRSSIERYALKVSTKL